MMIERAGARAPGDPADGVEPSGAWKKKEYTPPRLTRFGSVRELTMVSRSPYEAGCEP